MGNKRNKELRRICTRKRRNQRKKNTASEEHRDSKSKSATLLTPLTAVNQTSTDTGTTQERNYGETAEDEPQLVETDSQEKPCLPIHGRRVVNMMYFIQQLQKISSHSSLFDCSFKDMSLIGESRNGLISKYKFRCIMCKIDFIITSEEPASEQNINANLAAVTGITSAGIGYSQFQEITACMDLPIFTELTYLKIQDFIYEKWEATADESMERAAMRERDAAIAEGKLSNDGIPIVDVYADGVWSSRSYGNNYKALSGAAAIVGRRFGEVLFIGIRNKYCLVCARAEKKRISTPELENLF
ncbi:hypothetical protein PYW08_014738 [Mythimna loreyi]|uniref:Uncharacterized protein n=1 Tax=Mythimna loreyi TaxID=667449 RepID=A0ACC2R5F9_9NEOP|nr:hypothetical protein PYW08_014738 [Mythimna loreyi]